MEQEQGPEEKQDVEEEFSLGEKAGERDQNLEALGEVVHKKPPALGTGKSKQTLGTPGRFFLQAGAVSLIIVCAIQALVCAVSLMAIIEYILESLHRDAHLKSTYTIALISTIPGILICCGNYVVFRIILREYGKKSEISGLKGRAA